MGDVTRLAERVARLRAEISDLVTTDLIDVDGGTGPGLHAEVHRSVGQLQAFAARILARVESDGRWSASGVRTFGEWEARKHTASRGAVRREVELGHALEEALPATSAAIARGELSLEYAQVLARRVVSSDARRAALASDDASSNEAFLLARAATRSVDEFRREVDGWAIRVDAATADAEHEAACAKEYLSFTRKADGVALQGFVTMEHGEVLATALRAVAGVPSQGDLRSREERQAAALVDAGRIILDRGLSGGGQQVRPHLIVHVPFDTVQRLAAASAATSDAAGHAAGDAGGSAGGGADDAGGSAGGGAHAFAGAEPATLADGRPIPPALLARLACDSEVTRVVFGSQSVVLDVGRAKRTYAGQQRLAVIARDRSCRYPGCGAPPTLGEVHHVRSWRDNGETSVKNGILLCWFHHDLVHRRRVRIRRLDADWEFRRLDGELLTTGDPADLTTGDPADLTTGDPALSATGDPALSATGDPALRDRARGAPSRDAAERHAGQEGRPSRGSGVPQQVSALAPPAAPWGGPTSARSSRPPTVAGGSTSTSSERPRPQFGPPSPKPTASSTASTSTTTSHERARPPTPRQDALPLLL